MNTTRHAQANNPYMASFDTVRPTSYIIYREANNLYGWAMSQPIPICWFEWMTADEAR